MKIMPYSFEKMNDSYLISNMTRDFMIISEYEFTCLKNGNFTDETVLNKFVENRFVCSNDEQFEEIITLYRNIHAGLFGGTFLHIFVLTLECNLNCVYCQAESKLNHAVMDENVAKNSVEIALQSNVDDLTFEFQGGEPLSNFKTLKFIVDYSKKINKAKTIHYSVVTNTGLMTDEILDYLIANDVSICVSMDGPQSIHDKNRPTKNKTSNFDKAIYWYNKAKEEYAKCGKNNKVTALPTVTKYTLNHYKEFVDFYNDLGESSVSIRELSPYGRASTNWSDISYTYDEFLTFYKNCLNYIIELNLSGKSELVELYSQMYLHMIVGKCSVNFTDLRSPCGAVIGQIAYNWNGDIYTCDEGRMMSNQGVEEFKIGNVFESSYKDCIESDCAKCICSTSCIESNPDCTYCVFQYICGVCPIYSYYTQGNLIGRTMLQDRCKILSGKYKYLIKKLLIGTEDEREVLKKWGK